MTHGELVLRAERWLYNIVGCGVVFRELCCAESEQPDAIGWKWGESFLVECKASRSDFLADKKKIFRRYPYQGMGNHRFYMCPPGIIKPEEVPEGWQLLYVTGKQVRWPNGKPKGNCWKIAFSEINTRGEMTMMLSALRRMKIRGHLEEIYDGMIEKKPVYSEIEAV